MICGAAEKQSIPLIRVSFRTNEETGSRQYNAYEPKEMMGPFSSLRGFTNNPDATKPLLVIERPLPHSDARDKLCRWIENVTAARHRMELGRRRS